MAKSNQVEHASVGDIYAHALLPLARQAGDPGVIVEELQQICAILQHDPKFAELVSGHILSDNARVAMLERIFRHRMSDLTCDAVLVLAHHRRMGFLPDVVQAMRTLQMTEQGFVEVQVITATPLAEEMLQAVQAAIAEALGAKPLLKMTVDEQILGGVVIRVGDKIMDASVQTQLEKMKETLSRGPQTGQPR